MTKRKLITALALALGTSVASVAHAAISFDPDGASGPLPAFSIGAFDWGPTNLLAIGGNTAITNFISSGGACPAGGCNFDLLTHARVTAFLDDSGKPLAVQPAGLNSTFELTLIARYTETVTSVGGTASSPIVTFSTVPSAPGFLEMYYDKTPDSVDVSGYGFNDGTLILRGTSVGAADSSFLDHVTTTVPLDGTGGNDYNGQLTHTGSGGSDNIPVDNLTQDSSFFLTPLATFGIQFANISLGLPYISVNPSDCFTTAGNVGPVGGTFGNSGCTTLHINAPMSSQDVPPPPGYRPDIGLINAAFPTAGGGPDFMAQTDYNSPLSSVPEPGSLALLGFGLAALGLGRRQRK